MNEGVLIWRYLRRLAAAEGIPLAGAAAAEPLESEFQYWRDWVARGCHAGMAWLAKSGEWRRDPRAFFSDCQAVAGFGLPYHPAAFTPPHARIARYAAGLDYHQVFRNKLETILSRLQGYFLDLRAYIAVDTSPFMEKPLAARAGLGWIGKNTCLIHEAHGSFFFLGVLLLNCGSRASWTAGAACPT